MPAASTIRTFPSASSSSPARREGRQVEQRESTRSTSQRAPALGEPVVRTGRDRVPTRFVQKYTVRGSAGRVVDLDAEQPPERPAQAPPEGLGRPQRESRARVRRRAQRPGLSTGAPRALRPRSSAPRARGPLSGALGDQGRACERPAARSTGLSMERLVDRRALEGPVSLRRRPGLRLRAPAHPPAPVVLSRRPAHPLHVGPDRPQPDLRGRPRGRAPALVDAIASTRRDGAGHPSPRSRVHPVAERVRIGTLPNGRSLPAARGGPLLHRRRGAGLTGCPQSK